MPRSAKKVRVGDEAEENEIRKKRICHRKCTTVRRRERERVVKRKRESKQEKEIQA